MERVRYSASEERANYLTHGFGFIVSLIGLGMLIQKGWAHEDAYVLPGVVVFGLGLAACFLSSTVYHWVKKPDLKHKLRIIDHLCIYLLIAASYTPFSLVNLRDHWGIPVLLAIWTLAISGSIFKFSIRNKLQSYEKVDAIIYVLIGTFALLFIKPIVTHVEPGGVLLLLLGGAAYLVGVLFYLNKKIPYNHAIWHLFVLAGAGFHFSAVWWYLKGW